MPEDKGFPLSPGFELYTGGPDEPPNDKLEFRFTVALNEAGITEGPLAEKLTLFVKMVEGIVQDLSPRLE